MHAAEWQANMARRAAKRQAMRARVDHRAAMVRESLVELKTGQGAGLGPLLVQQAKELRDEHRRLTSGDQASEQA